jgi:hypothetical protein
VGTAIFLAFLAFVLYLAVTAKSRSPAGRYRALARSGVRGRALVLSASKIESTAFINMDPYVVRSMTLEIEVAGRAPYQVTDSFAVPRGFVEAKPGASLDVAVHPHRPKRVAVLGPGGFSGPWLRTGPPRAF